MAEHVRGTGTNVIVMLNAGSRPDDVARCRELGVDACLSKPVSQKELRLALLRTLMPVATGSAEAKVRAGDGSSVLRVSGAGRVAPLRILLAEDNVVNRRLALRLLEKEGHTVTAVVNGREVLIAMEHEPFELVLMDMQMPEMDGLEATSAIRERERSTGVRLPIVALTAHAMVGDRERCLAAGMDGYVSKPFDRAQLVDAIRRVTGEAKETAQV